MRLSQAKKLYQDQWLAFRIVENGDDPVGEVVLHENDRSRFRKRLHDEKVRGVYLTFAGELIPEGYAALF